MIDLIKSLYLHELIFISVCIVIFFTLYLNGR
jgi:hypothetical protein